jgi:hypothetical protein
MCEMKPGLDHGRRPDRRYAHPHSWRNEFQVPLNALLPTRRGGISAGSMNVDQESQTAVRVPQVATSPLHRQSTK